MQSGMEALKNAGNRVVGAKQTVKSLENNAARQVFIADDAEPKVVKPVVDLCQEKEVDWCYCGNMEELGKACGIKVGAAVAAIIE